jgi:group I intron endonuclease
MGYIYKITNTINNKCYIGVTTKMNPYERWKAHKSAIKNGKGCPMLMKAFNKYGEEAFKFEILIICFDDDVFYYEEDYIKKYNSMSPFGYNVATGGKSGKNFLGKKHSEETKKKIGIKSSERFTNQEVRERARQIGIENSKKINMSKILRNSEKWKKVVQEGRIGGKNIIRTQEVKEKISNGLKRYYQDNNSPINRPTLNREKHSEILTKVNGRKISQHLLDGTQIAVFDSIVLASKGTGIGRRSIQSCAIGRTKKGGRFIWKYVDTQKELKDC